MVSIIDPTGLNPDASGRENIGLLGRYLGRTRRELEAAADQITEFSGLGAFIDMPVKTYSLGMVARLAFAVGTHWQPDVVLMDEWIAVADESFKAAALERLTRFMATARCVVVASHDHHLLHRICNEVLVLDREKRRRPEKRLRQVRHGGGLQGGSAAGEPGRTAEGGQGVGAQDGLHGVAAVEVEVGPA